MFWRLTIITLSSVSEKEGVVAWKNTNDSAPRSTLAESRPLEPVIEFFATLWRNMKNHLAMVYC